MNRGSRSRFVSAAAIILGPTVGSALLPAARGEVVFAPAELYPVGDVPIGLTIADVDGDGALDVVSANSQSGDLSLLFNDGDGMLATEVRLDAGGGLPQHVVVGDVDADGDADLVASVRSGPGTIAVFLAESDGTFGPAVQYGTEQFSFVLAMTDLDGDADPDVAVATGFDVSVFRNAGDGTFLPAEVHAVFEAPVIYTADLAVADVDGEGGTDLIAVNDCPLGCNASIAILINAGDGTFLPPAPVALGVPNAGAVRAGDLDGDGNVDLALVDCGAFPGSDLVIGVNDGTGAFSALSRSPTGRSCTGFTIPDGLALLDVDTDGATDAVLTSLNDDEVRVLLNRGDLTFEAPIGLAVGDQPIAAAAGDLDGDGRADVVTADMGIGGAPTVTALINRTPAAGPAADLDGDGVVGTTDLLLLLSQWGACPGAPDPCPADLNGDGQVGVVDLLELLASWGG